MLLTQHDSQASILHFLVNAVESLGSCTADGIFLDGRRQDIGFPRRRASGLPALTLAAEGGPVTLADVPWAYSLSSRHGPAGYLLAGTPGPGRRGRTVPAAGATPAGRGGAGERAPAQTGAGTGGGAAHRQPRAAAQHGDSLPADQGALGGEGQQGIVQAVYELTERPAVIEDRFGNLLAWARPNRPEPYPRAVPEQRDRLLARAMTVAGPAREGERLYWVVVLGGVPVGVLILRDPDSTAGHTELVVMEHATTVLAMGIARLQSLAESDARLRTNLVLDLVAGAVPRVGGVMPLNRAQAMEYDLGRPHRVVLVEAHGDDEIDLFPARGRPGRPGRLGGVAAGATAARRDPAG
jgi:hypothetical protein